MNTRFSKSILVLVAASLLAAGPAMAGNGNSKGDGIGQGNKGARGGANTEWNGGPANRMARMSEALGLTDVQEDAILDFFRQQEAEREQLHADVWAMFGDQICAQREAHRDAFETMLAGILDADQLLLHAEMQSNREARRANRGPDRGKGRFECPEPAAAVEE